MEWGREGESNPLPQYSYNYMILLNIIRLTNIVGTFSATEQITGATSGTTANLGATATEFANDPKANNATIQTVADGIIDFSEGNPFSEGSF